MTKSGTLLFSGLLLALPSAAFAEGGSDAELAIRLPGTIGLTGTRDLIDGRTPGLLSIRTGGRYELFVRDRDFSSGNTKLSKSEERHLFVTYLGVSLLGFVDVAARIPYVIEDEDNNEKGTPDIIDDIKEDGWGAIDVAAKISLQVGWFTVAPYLSGRLPSGEPGLRDLAQFDYGTAVTFTLLNEYFSLHANLAGVQIEKGTSALRLRLGTAFVVWASDDWLLRAFAYGNAIEYEGSGDSDVDLEFGVQGVVFGMITVEISGSVRLVDGGHVNDDLKREIREAQSVGSFVDDHFEDDGTWAMQVGIGTFF